MKGLTVFASSYTASVFDGAGLRKQREALGLSLDDLSELARVNRITINRIELGKVKKPRRGTLRKLANALSQSKDQQREEVSWLRRIHRDQTPQEESTITPVYPQKPLETPIEKARVSVLARDIRAAQDTLTKAMRLLEEALRRAGG